MTLDVSIGKITMVKNDLFEDYDDEPEFIKGIERCPELDYDLCNDMHTIFPNEAYRSGSTGFWYFFYKKAKPLVEIYYRWRQNPYTNDTDIAKITKEDVNIIQNLDNNYFLDVIDADRLKWLKFWTKRARDLYGDEAGICFR